MRNFARGAVAPAVVAAVLLVLAARAGAAVPFEVDQPKPNVGDQISLESDALLKPPYNADPDRYVLALYICPGKREACIGQDNRFRPLNRTDGRGVAIEPHARYSCAKMRCVYKFRLPRAQEGTATFLAVVFERDPATGRFRERERSAGVEVTWVPAPPPPPPPTTGALPSLVLTVDGVTCKVIHRDPGPPEGHCKKLSPNGAKIRINTDGSARAPTFTAEIFGYPTETWRIQIYWQSRKFDCPGNPCSFALDGWPPGYFGRPPGDYIGRASVSAGLAWNEREPRGKDPRTGEILYGVQAEVAVDYLKP